MKVVRRKNVGTRRPALVGGEAKEKTDKDGINNNDLRRLRPGKNYNGLEKAVCNGDRP